MSAGTAYAVAQTMQDMEKVKKMKKEKFEGTKESLLGRCSCVKNPKEEVLEILEMPPYNRYQHYLCSIL